MQIRDKGGNAAYMVRQLYQKYLLGFDEHRLQQETSPAARQPSPGKDSISTFDRIVAEAKGKPDMDVLGAVAALMDAPVAQCHPHKRQKLDPAEVRPNLAMHFEAPKNCL